MSGLLIFVQALCALIIVALVGVTVLMTAAATTPY